MSGYLFTADLHLTGRRLDSYRWEVFDWLRTQGKARGVDAFFILGDLTDSKDNHNSKLVNRLVHELVSLASVAPVHAFPGNHDYTDPACPFFGFLGHLSDKGVHYHTVRTALRINRHRFLILPHHRDPDEAYPAREMEGHDFVLIHQPVRGALQENGTRSKDGLGVGLFRFVSSGCRVLAGDVHVPQDVFREHGETRARGQYDGKVTYCGAPHPVRFGDAFQPRVLYHDLRKLHSVPRTTLKKHIARITDPAQLKGLDLTEGDMVRVELRVPRQEFVHHREHQRAIRQICKDRGLVLCGCETKEKLSKRVRLGADTPVAGTETPGETLARYCAARGLDGAMAKAGRRMLLQETTK